MRPQRTQSMNKPLTGSKMALVAAVVALATGALVLDLFLPLGVAVGPLYAMPVLVSLWWPGRIPTIASSVAGTIFVVLDFFISPPGATFWIVLLNRGIALFVIWSTAMLVLYRKGAEEQIKILSGLLSICASCKKIRDEKDRWKPLEDYLKGHSGAEFNHSLCPDCLEEYQQLLQRRREEDATA
jgi:hypothetical protein